ncbi:MAG: serine hydrolase domain-containing protein [Oceanicaulis sp.]
MLALVFAAAALLAAQGQDAAPPPADAVEQAPASILEQTPAISAGQAERAALEAYVDGLVAVWMAEEPVPGLVVSVADADGVLLSKGYGLADIEAGAPASGSDTRFEIGSISKTFVWTAVMMLQEAGRLDIHEPVSTYLTGYTPPENEIPLTLAHLMSHRTGFDDTLALFLPGIAELDIDAALAASEPSLVHERGGAVAYSNWGTALAARVIEQVTGAPYSEFLYAEILQPLGMEDTTYREGERRADQPDLARSYDPAQGFLKEAFRLDIGAFASAGAIASTADDMARWMRFHINGGALDGVRLLQPETHARMQERLFPGREAGADMAHGFMSRPYGDQTLWGHGGAVNSFLSNMQIAQPLGLGVFVSQSGSRAGAFRLLPDLVIDHALERSPVNAPPSGRLALEDEALADYAGRYVPNRREFDGFEKLLTGMNLITVTALDGAIAVGGAGPTERYWPVAPDVFENRLGGRVVFQRGSDGEIVRMADESGTNSYETLDASSDPIQPGLAIAAAALFSLTTWLGLWRRMGRGQSVTWRGRLLSGFDLAAAALIFGFLGSFVAAAAGLMDLGLEMVAGYPQPELVTIALMSSVTVVVAGLVVLATAPVFAGSGWSIWRKLHHLLFALSLGALAVMLVRWDMAFSWPVTA